MRTLLSNYPKNSLFFKNDDIRRRHLLHILLRAIIVLAVFAFLSNLYGYFFIKLYKGTSPIITGSALLFYFLLLFLLQKVANERIAYIFVFSLFIINIIVSIQWGADLPLSLLFYSLIIIISGIVLSSKNAIFLSMLSCLGISMISYFQIHGFFHPSEQWRKMSIQMDDVFIYTVMLVIISLVSWLSNRETEKSLKKTKESEEALQKERDILEETVEKRTLELKQAEAQRIAQLYRFIEFGKLAGGLFHDFMTPLNLVSLNLENINEESKFGEKKQVKNIEKYLQDAMYGTQRLETFIGIARKQLQDTNHLQHFSLSEETEHVVKLFHYNSTIAKVDIQYTWKGKLDHYGNPLKYNQIITNLLSNALDAYKEDKKVKKKKIITIKLYEKNGEIFLIVSDNGIGMKQKDIKNIFEPLFTTKETDHMGLGLYLIKEIIQKDFKGSILVKSKPLEGTTFFISFPMNEL